MTLKRAIVTAVAPLRILIDGDTVPIPFTPKSLIYPDTLAVGDVVHADQSGHRLVVLGRVGGLGLLSGRNLIINGNFTVNQRVAASGVSLAPDAYFLDRWKSLTASNVVTWAGGEQGRVVTVPSGHSIGTILEQRDVPAGDYVLSWTGTAVVRVYNLAGTLSEYAASPVTVTLDGTAAVVIEARAGTLSEVKLERGSVATPFEVRPYGEELALCQRYYQRFGGRATFQSFAFGFARSTTTARISIPTPVSMRDVSPTLTYSTLGLFSDAVYDVSALTTKSSGANVIQVEATSSGLTAHRPYSLVSNGFTSGYVAFDAEL